ncbi:DMT family transporter [Oceanobacillus profundus]|uniref:DMT family transporter n=1 Tax=Oceanobacillus profundus TaxID=372463 RepID=A0A417YIN1_9BACI|nr:DMT family transporter [Oceanobacillus profundus]MBR3119629.1 DMT family transporter [Oceanobacillus sp.]PAE30729.1 EamA family transporter [Paenibacillus sp. 7884-2]MCM3398384.1 DMT family transporter [Oceanobacillus profundus]MDO6451363.1 DMT family transporter [Oceanobacillus profundus]RHW32861.1 DMT family transporter [Oceanobacillus profundus]
MKPKNINVLLVITIVCISLSAIFVKLSNAPSTIMVMYRMFLGCLLLLPFVLKYRKTLKQITRKEWLAIIFAGMFLAGHFGLWFESLNHTSVASSTLILALQPAIALIGGLIFFKEKIHLRTLLTLGIAFFGVAIVGGGNLGLGRDVLFGNILSLLSVFSVVFYLLIGQRNVKSLNHWVYSFLVFFFAGTTMIIFNIIGEIPLNGYSANDWMVFILLAIFPTGAHIIYNLLLNYVNTTTVSMSTLGEPIGASLLAIVFLNEMLTFVEIFGGSLIIIGIYLFLKWQSGTNKVLSKQAKNA